MAIDKAVDSAQLEADLTAVADAIRTRGGTTAPLSFPAGMAAAVAAIPGGGTIYSPDDDVCFYDYTGDLVFSCTLAEAQSMTSLPAPPDHSGDAVPLEFGQWNWTLEEINALDRPADIGAIYRAVDGKTHFTLELTEYSGLEVPLNFAAYNTSAVMVDWGDGSAVEASAVNSGGRAMSHTYPAPGTYQVSAWCDGDTWSPGGTGQLGLCGTSDKNPCIVGTFVMGSDVTFAWPSSVGTSALSATRIEYLVYPYSERWAGTDRFSHLRELKFLAFRVTQTEYLAHFAYGCISLRGIALPPNVVAAGDYGFAQLKSLHRLCLPKSFTMQGSAAQRLMYSGTVLSEVQIPEGTTSIPYRCFADVTPMQQLTIPASVTSIGEAAFTGCAVREFYLLPEEPPTLSSTSAFGGGVWGTAFIIHVRAASVEAYKAATNWVTFADQIVGDIDDD